MEVGRFAMIPLAAIADNRLTLRMLKTFAAICSFRKSADDFSVQKTRGEIAERCGLHPSIISTATTELEILGWLKKTGRGGSKVKTTYLITVAQSETVTDSATVSNSVTVTESETVTDSVSRTVTDSATLLYTKEVNTEKAVSAPDGFSEFWDAYGKKVGKVAAFAQWKKLNPNAALVSLMIAAARRYSATTEQQFRKDPERWIRDRRWEDETPGAKSAEAEDSIFAGAL